MTAAKGSVTPPQLAVLRYIVACFGHTTFGAVCERGIVRQPGQTLRALTRRQLLLNSGSLYRITEQGWAVVDRYGRRA